MKALLIRVGIDSKSGGGNAPVILDTNKFVYVPIPEEKEVCPEYKRTYEAYFEECKKFGRPLLAKATKDTSVHLDPDFCCLTYGDIYETDGTRHKGKPLLALQEDDLLVFYAGLDPGRGKDKQIPLVYAIIGLYVIKEEPKKAADVILMGMERGNNAHTRRRYNEADIIVTAKPEPLSGRLEKCIPIGERKNGRYYLQQNLFNRWGGFVRSNGLSFNKLYLQRSIFFRFKNADKFYDWFKSKKIQLSARNN